MRVQRHGTCMMPNRCAASPPLNRMCTFIRRADVRAAGERGSEVSAPWFAYEAPRCFTARGGAFRTTTTSQQVPTSSGTIFLSQRPPSIEGSHRVHSSRAGRRRCAEGDTGGWRGDWRPHLLQCHDAYASPANASREHQLGPPAHSKLWSWQLGSALFG